MVSKNDLPDSLTNLSQWVLMRTSQEENGHFKKEPFSANYEGHASSSNPKTWASFDKVASMIKENELPAFAITEPFIFIDLDSCFDDIGLLSETALDIVGKFKTAYIERSV